MCPQIFTQIFTGDLADLKASTATGKSIEEVHSAMTDAIHEIERTYTRYYQDSQQANKHEQHGHHNAQVTV